MTVRPVPPRHWRSYGDDPLPTGREALGQPFTKQAGARLSPGCPPRPPARWVAFSLPDMLLAAVGAARHLSAAKTLPQLREGYGANRPGFRTGAAPCASAARSRYDQIMQRGPPHRCGAAPPRPGRLPFLLKLFADAGYDDDPINREVREARVATADAALAAISGETVEGIQALRAELDWSAKRPG